ncbi:MAG: hypothetical protein A2002_05970 [Pseudomonadales bacterium GWC1_66_9]|nr:MAG: hypothetical protein A2002_05970 [Pseudomonadales bacterium GWC1_66_9]
MSSARRDHVVEWVEGKGVGQAWALTVRLAELQERGCCGFSIDHRDDGAFVLAWTPTEDEQEMQRLALEARRAAAAEPKNTWERLGAAFAQGLIAAVYDASMKLVAAAADTTEERNERVLALFERLAKEGKGK